MIIVVLLLMMLGFGGGYAGGWGTPYGYGGFGLGGVLLVVLVAMLLTGRV